MEIPKSLNDSLDYVKYEQYVNNLNDRLPQLVDPNDIDCKRWPWELLQNAKDTVVKRKNPEDRYVDVTIKYYTDNDGKKKLYFEHNGDQFTSKAITGLVWKFSAEKRNEQTTEDGLTRDKQSTGRFGTGFMTTHALSLTVDVSGSIFHDDPDIMRNVSIDFTLHREGPDDEAYKKGVDQSEREIKDNMDKRPIPTGQILPTRFTYHINKESGEKAAKMGIDNVRTNAAQTMLFCPSVRSIIVIDEENHETFKITRKNKDERKNVVKETIFVEESSDNGKEAITRRFISMEIEEYSKEISSHCKTKDRNLRLHVAVEVDNDNNILPIPSTSPSVYCSLPLIGFENMTLPFYINSNDFEPTTERTALYLKKKRFENRTNEDTEEEEVYYLQSGVNWSIFERSLPLFENIVDYLVDNKYNKRYNLINGLCNVLNGAWGIETKNCLASRFVVPLRNMLVRKNLVKTSDGYRSIASDVKFVECSKEYDLHVLYEICKTIYGNDLVDEEENENWVALKWGRFTFDSEFDEKKQDNDNPSFPTVKYDKVAKYIEDAGCVDNLSIIIDNNSDSNNICDYIKEQKLKWLNKFYEWIEVSKVTNLSDKKIVPNRLGDFCSIEQGCDLKDASDIETKIFDFIKMIEINWDKNLLMEGVQHVTLTKETKDNVVAAIKNRTKEIRDNANYNENEKLKKLIPLLLALPSNEDGRVEDFYQKRVRIVSIMNTMYRSLINDIDSIKLSLKSETWEDTDKWFMNVVAKDIANRKKLDVINEDDSEDAVSNKYCTAAWLSSVLDFMFQKSYLHQEDITSKEDKTDHLSIIPNRYGDFCPINDLHRQGCIPNELIHEELNQTGYDVKKELLYDGFDLNNKVSIKEMSVSDLATKYNEYFESIANDNKESVANYLIHLVPGCGEQYEEIRNLYDEYNLTEKTSVRIINTSDLNIWKGAKDYIIGLLAENASSCDNVSSIGDKLNKCAENKNFELNFKTGMSWLNRLANIIRNNKYAVSENLKLIPDWRGTLHAEKDMVYDGSVLLEYNKIQFLIDIVEGGLWSHYDDNLKEEGEDNIIETIVNSNYKFVKDFQKNTDEKLFGIVDKLIDYCRNNNDTSWHSILKKSIDSLLRFFEDNKPLWGDDSKWKRNFRITYNLRKELYYDYICDAETKARITRINDNFSPDEIESLIKEKESVKEILANKDYYNRLEDENKSLQGKIEDLKCIHSFLQGCPNDKIAKLKEYIRELANGRDIAMAPLIQMGYDDEEEAIIEARLNGSEITTVEQKAENDEAKKIVLNHLANKGFDISNVNSDFSIINGVVLNDKNYPLVVKSCKNKEHRIWLNPNEWKQLFKPNSMLWLHFGEGMIAPIKAYELFTYQDKLTLSFDTMNLMMDSRINKIMEVLRYFNKVHLNLASIKPTISRANMMDQYSFNDNNIDNSNLDSSEI